MKKKLSGLTSFGLLAVVLVLIYSCSDDSTKNAADLNKKEVNIERLLSNLKEYDRANFDNSTIRNSDNFAKPCKGWWDCGRRFVEVSGADIAGAGAGAASVQLAAGIAGAATAGTGYVVVSVAGAAIVGAGASSAMLRVYDGHQIPLPESQFGNPLNNVHLEAIYGNLDVIISDDKYSVINNTGKLHNFVIHNYEKNSIQIDQALYNHMGLEDEGVMVIDYIKERGIINKVKELTIRNYNNENNFDHRQLLSAFEQENLMTVNAKEILSIFLDSFKSIQQPKELERLINFYLSEIQNSTLEENDKIIVLSALMVASESPFYTLGYTKITEND